MIKNVIVVSILTFTIFTGYTQVEIPAKVKTTFKNKFPAAQNQEWELNSDGNPEVRFDMKDESKIAVFHNDGSIAAIWTGITEEEIPESAKSNIEKQHPDYYISEAWKTESGTNVKGFVILIGQEDSDHKLTLDESGKITKTEEIPRAEEENYDEPEIEDEEEE